MRTGIPAGQERQFSRFVQCETRIGKRFHFRFAYTPFMRRTIFYVSDGTGITAETIGHSVLTQFDGVDFQTFRIPFVDDDAKARSAALRIKTAYAQNGVRPIVVNTIMDQKLSDI